MNNRKDIPLFLETFRDVTGLQRPTTPNFFHTANSGYESLNSTYQSLDSTLGGELMAGEELTAGVSSTPSAELTPSAVATSSTPSAVTRAYSYCDESTKASKSPGQVSRLSKIERYLAKLKAANRLGALTGLIMSRAYKTYAFQCLYRSAVTSNQQEILTQYLFSRRVLSLSFRRWLQLLHRRTVAELNFLLRKATADNSALTNRLRKAIDNQASLEMLLRQQRKEVIDLKEAVWSVWQTELSFADQRHSRLAQCVRELNSISYELEKDRKEKEPLLHIEFDDFFHRLVKHHKIRHRSLREMTS